MWSAARRYDTYPRGGPKIYVGEYAVTQNAGEGNLGAALAEAAAMTGFLRNADVVKMASYAPLLVNVNNRQWNPNAIVFDAERSYGTPSYWVQWLFSRNKPDRILAHSIQADSTTEQPFAGKIGLQTWKTHAEFRHVSLKVDGEDVPVSMRFEPAGGTWRVDGEVLSQSDLGENRRSIFAAVEIPAGAKRVVLSLQARKLGGDEGFIVMTSLAPGHEFQWNLGGWGNSLHAFQRDGGRIEPGVPGRIETDRWYDVRIEREGRHVRGYLDGQLVQEIEEPLVEDFAGVAGLDQTAREIVLFLVNGAPTSRKVELSFVGPKPRGEARGWVLSGKNLTDENSFQAPSKVRPRAIRVSNIGEIPLQVGPNSVTVLRVPTG